MAENHFSLYKQAKIQKYLKGRAKDFVFFFEIIIFLCDFKKKGKGSNTSGLKTFIFLSE